MARNIKKIGFTLAEVLITLGVLGVISSITIPNLSYNYRAKVLEQQLRTTYSDIKELGNTLNIEHGGNWAEYANGMGYNNWFSEFVQGLNGGNSYTLPDYYKIFKFSLINGLVTTSYPCDDGGTWIDNKGRIWKFNAENSIVCVDINGVTKPNRLNVDIFAFIPMTPEMLAIWVYDDPDHPENYTSSFIPCNLDQIQENSATNNIPTKNEIDTTIEDNPEKPFEKGSGSALDYCPFFEPIENIAVPGQSAKGKTVTRNNNYWKDYINYK